MQSMIIAGNAPMFGEALCSMVQDEVEVLAVVDGDEAERRTNGYKPDIVLVHSGLDGFGWDKTIALVDDDVRDAVWALDKGADSVVSKREGRDVLLKAIHSDQPYINPRLSLDIIAHKNKADELTEREREVLVNVAQGYTSMEIAEMMFLSPRTIESHRSSIVAKLDSNSRRDLVRAAIDLGLFREVFA